MRMRMLHSTYVGAALAAAGLMYVFFLYYTTSSSLRTAEARLGKLTEINERLTAQQQVVVGHKQRLERSLDEAKERLTAAKEDSEKRYQGLKALKEELQQKLEQEAAARARVEEDSRRRVEQHAVEYQLLKQEKEAAVSKLTGDLSNQKVEAARLQAEVDRVKAEATYLQQQLDKVQAEARSAQAAASSSANTVQELHKTVASLEAEVASLRAAAGATLATKVSVMQGSSASASANPPGVLPARHASNKAVAELAQDAATIAAGAADGVGAAAVGAAALRGNLEAEAVQHDDVKLTAPPAAAAAAAAQDMHLNEPQRQVAMPLLNLGDHRDQDEKMARADRLGDVADDDDGVAGNRDEEDEEERNHALAHAKPDGQVPPPQGALVERLRAAVVAGRKQRAVGGKQADESMQVDKPPEADDNGQVLHRDQEGNEGNRAGLWAAANKKIPDEP